MMRRHAQHRNISVEEWVSAFLEENMHARSVLVDAPLSDNALERRIFNAVTSSPQLQELQFSGHHFQPKSLLTRTVRLWLQSTAMPSVTRIAFVDLQMSGTEAHEIFAALESSLRRLPLLALQDITYNDDVVSALARYLKRTSLLEGLFLVWKREDGATKMSEAMFSAFCDALSESTGLKRIAFWGSPVEDVNAARAQECFANALAKSFTLNNIGIYEASETFTVDQVCHALSSTTQAVCSGGLSLKVSVTN